MATCDPDTLLQEGRCLNCLTDHQLLVVLAQLYCNGGGGGGGGSQEVFDGNGDPNGVVTPTVPGSPALYYNLDVPGEIWYWDTASQTWF